MIELPTKQLFVGRTKRLRRKIIKFLEEKGQADTADVYEFLKHNTYWGASQNQVGNILAKDPRFVLVGNTRRAMGMHSLQIYQLSSDYKEYEEA